MPPSGGWDCHGHVFGPYTRYPLAPNRSYTPPEAPASAYLVHLQGLGLAHGVLVHPSAYGTDRVLLFDTLAAHPHLRGVLVARAGDPLDWSGLRGRGVRALRFSARSGAGTNFAGSASFEDLLTLAPQLADAGLHAELWTDCKTLEALAPQILQLPVPVVIDHMGGFDVQAGTRDAGFVALLHLLASGRVWIKLCVYRNLLALPNPSDLEPGRAFHEAMLATNPQRLVWGSDWPHLRVTPAPDALDLLETLRGWTTDTGLQRKLLVENPARLYA